VDHCLIDGAKTLISNGQNADYIIVVDGPERKPCQGMSLVVVEPTLPVRRKGFAVRTPQDRHERAGHVRVVLRWRSRADRQLLGEVEAGLCPIDDAARLGAAANCDHRRDQHRRSRQNDDRYTKERKAFRQMLLEFQIPSSSLPNAPTIATVARTFIDQMIVRLLAGELDAATAAMAKLWINRATMPGHR